MSVVATLFGMASLFCGLVADGQWYRASKVVATPKFSDLSDDAHDADFIWELIRAIMVAGREPSSLNRLAALWTAAAVLLGGVTSLLSALSLHWRTLAG